jgi:hypothetical protein
MIPKPVVALWIKWRLVDLGPMCGFKVIHVEKPVATELQHCMVPGDGSVLGHKVV